MPLYIRTDNGAPFASTGLAGLSRLAVWWMRLGIQPERIEPGRPEQNGRHERFHETLKAENPDGRDSAPKEKVYGLMNVSFRAALRLPLADRGS